MFNPYYGLFEYSATDNYTLQVKARDSSDEHVLIITVCRLIPTVEFAMKNIFLISSSLVEWQVRSKKKN